MCGILGIVDRGNQPVEQEALSVGLKMLAHRGPDGAGTYCGKNFALGHRRLAIFDTSQQGTQPMQYLGKVITFNGAIYNFPELREELEKYDYRFHTETDTEVILAAYDHWGVSCVERFNGQWAFAIYDPEKDWLFCSRDRFGIKPLYYAIFESRFHFASEIKAFKPLKGWQQVFNDLRVYEYLAYGLHDHTDETLYQHVFQVPQGCNLIYDLNIHTWKITSYYSLKEQEKAPPSNFEDTIEQFRCLLQDAVRLRMRADVPFGAALSGGLDSSSLVRIIQDWSDEQPVTTVSACFPGEAGIDETPYVDALVNERPFNNLRIIPDHAQFMALQQKVSIYQDEPINSHSIIAQFLVFQRARTAGLKVMLDGQGADEILGGYPKFYSPYFKGLARSNPVGLFPAMWNFVQLHEWSFRSIVKKMIVYSAKSKGLMPAWIHPEFQPDPGQQYRPTPIRNIRELSIQLITEMGLPALLHYEDRNAMANGIESRLPFLDHRLVEFCLALPEEYLLHGARRKYLLREAMRPHLPDLIYRRYDKMGFEVPEWSPTAAELKTAVTTIEETWKPIVRSKLDVTQLPTAIRERIYFFDQFLQS